MVTVESRAQYEDEFKIGQAFVADIVLIGPAQHAAYLDTSGLYITGLPNPALNQVTFADPHATIEHVEQVLAHAEAFGVPYGVSAPASVQPAVVDAVQSHGFVRGEPAPVLLLDDADLLAQYATLPTTTTELVTEANYDEFVAIMVEVFNFPTTVLEQGWPDFYPVRSGRMPIRLAYVDGELAGVAQARVNDNAIGIFNVGVAERYRGRGLGRALTHASITDGLALGGTFAFLGATAMGYALYKAMGFRDAGARVSFTLPDADH